MKSLQKTPLVTLVTLSERKFFRKTFCRPAVTCNETPYRGNSGPRSKDRVKSSTYRPLSTQIFVTRAVTLCSVNVTPYVYACILATSRLGAVPRALSEKISPTPSQTPLCNRLSLDLAKLRSDLTSNLRQALGLGASVFRHPPVHGLGCRDASPTLFGPRSGALAAMTRAPPRSFHRWAFAGRTGLGSGTTALARPVRPEARSRADLVAFSELHPSPQCDCYIITQIGGGIKYRVARTVGLVMLYSAHRYWSLVMVNPWRSCPLFSGRFANRSHHQAVGSRN